MKPGDWILTAVAALAAVWAIVWAVLAFRANRSYEYYPPSRWGYNGHNIVLALRAANESRLDDLWPTKGEWASSTDYLDGLPGLTEGLCKDDVDGPWCCLAGIRGEGDDTPFLWSDNLEVTGAMLRGEPADWREYLRDDGPVVIVHKDGSVRYLKKKFLSADTFFEGGLPRDPDALEVLRPRPGSGTAAPDPHAERAKEPAP